MHLNHLDLHVPDVPAARDFFTDHLGFMSVETRGGDGLAILRDSAGLELVLSRPIEKFGTADAVATGYNTYHIGFVLPAREEVDALYGRLKSAGAEVGKPPAAIRGGWLFYCYAPGRILVEIAWRPPAEPAREA